MKVRSSYWKRRKVVLGQQSERRKRKVGNGSAAAHMKEVSWSTRMRMRTAGTHKFTTSSAVAQQQKKERKEGKGKMATAGTVARSLYDEHALLVSGISKDTGASPRGASRLEIRTPSAFRRLPIPDASCFLVAFISFQASNYTARMMTQPCCGPLCSVL